MLTCNAIITHLVNEGSGGCPPAQVFDLRSAARMASSVPFNAGATLLRFHPKFSSTLLVASPGGTLTLADTGGATYNRYHQVHRPGALWGKCPATSNPPS